VTPTQKKSNFLPEVKFFGENHGLNRVNEEKLEMNEQEHQEKQEALCFFTETVARIMAAGDVPTVKVSLDVIEVLNTLGWERERIHENRQPTHSDFALVLRADRLAFALTSSINGVLPYTKNFEGDIDPKTFTEQVYKWLHVAMDQFGATYAN
jgi:hypothetical protein